MSLYTELPRTDTLVYWEPQQDSESKRMEFRLIYKGPLPSEGSGGSRTKEKHTLRKYFHGQLRELWNQHPDLKQQANQHFVVKPAVYPPGALDAEPVPAGHPNGKTHLDRIADDYQRCGGRFVPLIRKGGALTCSLEILFLRRDNPGHIISSGGDIDNRLKVLFDGLRMPDNVSELGGLAIEPDENPFFCLVEDDGLITSVSVTTDRLLSLPDPGDKVHDVELVIHVTVVNQSALFAGGRLM